MSTSGLRWGDSSSSESESEEETRIITSEKKESSSESELDGEFSRPQKQNTRPTKVTYSQQNRRGAGGRGGDNKWDNRSGRTGRMGGNGRGGNSAKQGRSSNNKVGGRGNKNNGRKGGKQFEMSVSIGADEWKDLAKEAKKYGKDTFEKSKSFDDLIEGNNWMANRQKKAEEKLMQKRLKHEKEQEVKDKNTSSLKTMTRQEGSQTSLTELEKRFSSQSTSSNKPSSRPKLVLKPRTLPIFQKVDANENDIEDPKGNNTEKEEKESVTPDVESEADDSIVTASSTISNLSKGRIRDKNYNRQRGGRGRGRGRGRGKGRGGRGGRGEGQGNHRSPHKPTDSRSNTPKKEKPPRKKPVNIKADLQPDGTVRLTKYPLPTGKNPSIVGKNSNGKINVNKKDKRNEMQ